MPTAAALHGCGGLHPGTTGFTYTVTDGLGGFDSGTVTFNVGNSAVAGNDNLQRPLPAPLSSPARACWATTATPMWMRYVCSVLDASGLDGSLTLSADGSFSFAPTAGLAAPLDSRLRWRLTWRFGRGYGRHQRGANTAPVAGNEAALHMGQRWPRHCRPRRAHR